MKFLRHLNIIILLGFVQTTFSQTFVDDIDKVAVVVIDYCVNESGERYNIEINKEKTTYNNEPWKQGCLQHFKDGTLIYPMRMVNQCWQSVYYFVNSKYKTAELQASDKVKCKVFHEGEFKYQNPAYSNTKIIRRKHKQIEKSPDNDKRQVYKIEWIKDYNYTLKTLKLPLAKDKHKIGRLIYVEIIEILDKNTYLYKAYEKGDDNVIYGIIKKVS